MIPRIVQGPWMVKKMVGTSPIIIGQKLPVTYYGSIQEQYLEICMDVTKGGQMANSIATTCSGKADLIAVDLGFVLEGSSNDVLPEVMLGAFRLHHLQMKSNGGFTEYEWRNEISKRMTTRKAAQKL